MNFYKNIQKKKKKKKTSPTPFSANIVQLYHGDQFY